MLKGFQQCLYTLLCFLAFNKSLFAQDKLSQIILGPLLDSVNVSSVDYEVFKAIEVWKNFLLSENDSLLISVDRGDSGLRKLILDEQLFTKSFVPKEDWIFHIVAYERIPNGYILETIIQFKQPDWHVNYMLSYFRIAVKKVNRDYKIFFLFDENLKGFDKIKTKWIDYYLEKDIKIPEENFVKANKFCDSISKIFNLNYSAIGQANYIISTKNRTYQVFGHYYYWNSLSARSFTARGKQFILDNKANGKYFHELVHFLFSRYDLMPILDEGMATWLAGPIDNVSFKQAKDSLKMLPYGNYDTLDLIIERRPPYWQNVYFDAVGGILLEQAYKTGGMQLVNKIITDKSCPSIYCIAQKYFGQKNFRKDARKIIIDLIEHSKND